MHLGSLETSAVPSAFLQSWRRPGSMRSRAVAVSRIWLLSTCRVVNFIILIILFILIHSDLGFGSPHVTIMIIIGNLEEYKLGSLTPLFKPTHNQKG